MPGAYPAGGRETGAGRTDGRACGRRRGLGGTWSSRARTRNSRRLLAIRQVLLADRQQKILRDPGPRHGPHGTTPARVRHRAHATAPRPRPRGGDGPGEPSVLVHDDAPDVLAVAQVLISLVD